MSRTPGHRPAPCLALVVLASLLGLSGCQDEDVVDDPIFPDNVSATVQRCEIVDGRAVATVEVTNGTGHPSAYEVTMAYVADGMPDEIGSAESEEIAPGRSGQVQIRSTAREAVDECDLRDVEDLSA